MFNRKGLHNWHVTESSTRVRKVENSAQTSLLDQVFDGLVCSVDVLALVGKIFSFRTLTSMLPLLPISLSSELSDGSTVCSIQALV